MITLGLGFAGGILVTLGIQHNWDWRAVGGGFLVLVTTAWAELSGFVPTLFGG